MYNLLLPKHIKRILHNVNDMSFFIDELVANNICTHECFLDNKKVKVIFRNEILLSNVNGTYIGIIDKPSLVGHTLCERCYINDDGMIYPMISLKYMIPISIPQPSFNWLTVWRNGIKLHDGPWWKNIEITIQTLYSDLQLTKNPIEKIRQNWKHY